MTTNEARRASDRGYQAMLRNEKDPMSETDFVDLIADILICGELHYGVTATEVVESALEHVRGELDGDEFTSGQTFLPQQLRVRDYDPTGQVWAYSTDDIAWGWRDAGLFADIIAPTRDDAVIYRHSGWEKLGFEGLPMPDPAESGCDDAWRWVQTPDGKVWALPSIDVEEVTA